MNAVVLMLGLLGGPGLSIAQQGELPREPVPVFPSAAPSAAPEPLPPQLQPAGAPQVPELSLPDAPPRLNPVTAPRAAQPPPALAPMPPPPPVETPPARPPPFKLIVPVQKQAATSNWPPAPAPHAVPVPPPLRGAQTPLLTLETHGPPSVRAGQPFAYEIVVRNVGAVPALQVHLENELPPGTRVVNTEPPAVPQGDRLVWHADTMPAGVEQRFRVEVVPAMGGEWLGKATLAVAVAQTLRAEVSGAAAAPVTVGLAGPGTALLGHPIVFEVRLSNTAGVPTQPLVLRVPLPPGLEHLLGSDIEAPLEPLAPGETRTLKLDVVAIQTGRHPVAVSLRAGKQVLTSAHAEVVVNEEPVLALHLVGPSEGWAGGETEYRLAVTNRSAFVSRNVTVTDVLPEGVAYVGSVPAFHDPKTRTVRWSLGDLESGQTKTVALKVVSRATGRVLNQATARNDQGSEARLHSILRFRAPRPGNR